MTKIEWTNEVWNPITGCTKVSAGCKNCYAETIAKRFWGGRKFSNIKFHPERLDKPLHWKKPRMVFVNSMSDLFHEKIKTSFLAQTFDVMENAKQHTFQILTKRPERMKSFRMFHNYFPYKIENNIWFGVSVENQKSADERIPLLLETPAAMRWVSIEPMLEEINLDKYCKELNINWLTGLDKDYPEEGVNMKIDWVVIGSESGAKRRQCKLEWVESVVRQCKEANVPVFVKQLQIAGKVEKDIGKFPKHLQIREYPK